METVLGCVYVEEERRAGVQKREHGPVLENSNSVVGHPQEGLTMVLQRVTERGVVGELQVLRIPSSQEGTLLGIAP